MNKGATPKSKGSNPRAASFEFRFSRFGFRVPAAASLAVVLLSAGCLHRPKRPTEASRRAPPPTIPLPPRGPIKPTPTPAPIVQGEEGLASWYGYPYHGRRTASGEIYNMYAISAAHRTLPFGTEVRVRNLENGHEVVVRINDRGPFVEGRIIDLSYAAAQTIRMQGTAHVRLEILGLEQGRTRGIEPGIFGVQVGAFKERDNAERLKEIIAPRFGPVTVVSFDSGDGILYRVRVGHESSEEAARNLARNLQQASLASDAFVVRLN